MTVIQEQDLGYIESAQRLVGDDGRRWDQRALLRVAEAAKLRNTGWPIGLVSQRAGLAPVPTPDGVEARIRRDRELGRDRGQEWEDYWAFHKDGSYYVVRLFEEEFRSPSFTSSEGHPSKALWFDIRIWRIAEVLLHSAYLYRELGIPPDEPYLLALNHGGLADREFYVSTLQRLVGRGRISRVPAVSWTKEVTQDYVAGNLKSLVGEVAADLFVVFDFAEITEDVIDGIVDEFLGSGL